VYDEVESVPVQATAKFAAKVTANTSKEVSQTKNATENDLKRPESPLSIYQMRERESKRIKYASSSM
jgi:hypothetical protein